MSAKISKILMTKENGNAAAIRDAEFASKKWVWLSDKEKAFVKGFVTSEDNDMITVHCDDGTERRVHVDSVDKVNPPQFDKANDMAELTFLNEASVVNNLQTRYMENLIYTYSGLFLVAVNPYAQLPIYDRNTVNAYKKKQREEMPPHIYAVTDQAFRYMLEMSENQSILVTGESGAGKTENTKKVIQYLAAIARPAGQKATGTEAASFEQQILQANPILEAFGNAQTVRNNNSSRFGKFVRIEFSRSGQIAGASIDWYLLEKSRVIQQTSKERNYHIFYQILAGGDKKLKEKIMLNGGVGDYAYVKNSNWSIDGVDDSKEFRDLLKSFQIMGLSEDERLDIFRVMSVILNIGNIQVKPETADQGRILNISQAEKVAHLLGINAEQFMKNLSKPTVKAGRELVTQSRSAEQIRMSLDALSKNLYERTFGYIVDRINMALEKSDDSSMYIGVLDIAGFEIFQHNSFEQLCINYTNEKLQQFFNHHMFVLEQEEYSRENIDWNFIDFGHDLQPTIDLIEKSNPMGIFSCLDEDCVMPKATDKTFTEKLSQLWTKKSNKFSTSKLTQGFKLSHYAGEVEYSTEGWLEKNKDPLNDSVVQQLVESSETLIQHLFKKDGSPPAGTGRVKKGLFRTVAQRHKEHLNHLLEQLNSTQPHFVRCIIPNQRKKPKSPDNNLVLEQLRCNGVLEGIRIARTGYPNRIPFTEFRLRYEVLTTGLSKEYADGLTACKNILEQLHLTDGLYKIGITKIFFKAGVLAELEERRDLLVRNLITKFQTIARGSLIRSRIQRDSFKQKAVEIIHKNFDVYLRLKKDPWWKLYVKMRPLVIAARETGENHIRDAEFKKLQNTIKAHQDEKEEIIEKAKNAEKELLRITEILESERHLALDKEEILKRAKTKEADLQEQLNAAYDDLDKVEAQMDDLILAKKKSESDAELWKSELTKGAKLIQMLEHEKENLKEKLSSLESEFSEISKQQKQENNEAQKLLKEVKFLKSCISQKDTRIFELNEQVKKSDEEIEKQLQEAQNSYTSANRQIKNLVEENQDIRKKLQELNNVAAEYEVLLDRKEKELLSLTSDLKTHASRVKSIDQEKSALETKYRSLSLEIETVKNEKKELHKKHMQLEKEARQAKQLLESKISEADKREKGQKLLDEQLETLKKTLADSEESRKTQLLRSKGELDAKQNQINKLQKEREDLLENSKQLKLAKNEIDVLKKDIEMERVKLVEMKKVQKEIEIVKEELKKSESASKDLSATITMLTSKLENSQTKSSNLSDHVQKITNEKKSLENDISGLQRKHQQVVHDLESANMAKASLMNELSDLKKEASNMGLEKQKLQKDVEQKTSQMEKLRASITADMEKRIQKLIEEKNSLELGSKKVKMELESLSLKNSANERQKQRLTQQLEDLGHDLAREQKQCAASENAKATLKQELDRLKNTALTEKRNRSEREVEKRKLAAALESTKQELEERTKQLLALQKVVKPKSSVSRDSDMSNVSEMVDLAVRLEEAEKRCKKAEEGQALAQDQLEAARQRWSKELDDKDAKFYANRRALLEDLANVSSPLPPRSPTRSRNLNSEEKENMGTLHSRSKEQLQDMLVRLQKNHSDLTSVYQETSQNLLNTREQLSESKKKLGRLEKDNSKESDISEEYVADLKLNLETEISRNKELESGYKLYKSRAEEYYERLEQAESIVLKATRAEKFAKTQQNEAEESLKKATRELRQSETMVTALQTTVNKLEGELEQKTIDLNYSKEAHKRSELELTGLKNERSKELNTSSGQVEAMRSRYSEEIRTISSELETEKQKNAEIENSLRKAMRQIEEFESKNSFDYRLNPKQRDLENEIQTLKKAREEASMAYDDSQMRIGSLLSQVKNLRVTMGDITSNRDQLQSDKRALEKRLDEAYKRYEELASSVNDPKTISRQKSMRALPDDELKSIQKALEAQKHQTQNALDQLNRTKQQLKDGQDAIDQEKRFNQELKKIHEKEKQALNLKLIDLEARLLSPQSNEAAYYKKKVDELENQLKLKEDNYFNNLRRSKSSDRSVKDLNTQLSQKDKLLMRLQQEAEANEQKMKTLRLSLENIQAEEAAHRVAARKAEREAREAKERALELERDLEGWKQRSNRYGTQSFV